MRGSEQDRQTLIERLKTVKDPREREKILWALEGLKKDAYGIVQPQTKEPPAPAQAKTRIPIQMPKGLGLLTRFAAPFFFILFGLAFILQAVFRGLERKDFASEAGQFITGAILLVFGFSALHKVRKLGSMPEAPKEGEKKPADWP